VVITGAAASDFLGYSVARVGDFNSDGLGDVIVGAFGADPNGALSGQAYILFGTQTPFATALEISTLTQSQGLIINGTDGNDRLGFATANSGDFNGDGVSDVLLSAPIARGAGRTNAGQAYIVFGTNMPPTVLEISALTQTQGHIINGAVANDLLGLSLGGN
ncbi:MAG: integrin alpha, partial [Planctomycetota bacterium]|nr:integrin alpha [Planctomycetota bacterium]